VNTGNGIGIDPSDPVIQGNSKLNSSALNAGFGINYNWNNFNLGISMPTIFGNNDEYELNSNFKYKTQRQFQVHSSYLFELSENWSLQTIGVNKFIILSPEGPGVFPHEVKNFLVVSQPPE